MSRDSAGPLRTGGPWRADGPGRWCLCRPCPVAPPRERLPGGQRGPCCPRRGHAAPCAACACTAGPRAALRQPLPAPCSAFPGQSQPVTLSTRAVPTGPRNAAQGQLQALPGQALGLAGQLTGPELDAGRSAGLLEAADAEPWASPHRGACSGGPRTALKSRDPSKPRVPVLEPLGHTVPRPGHLGRAVDLKGREQSHRSVEAPATRQAAGQARLSQHKGLRRRALVALHAKAAWRMRLHGPAHPSGPAHSTSAPSRPLCAPSSWPPFPHFSFRAFAAGVGAGGGGAY